MRILAALFGLFFLLIGMGGLTPLTADQGYLFKIFKLNLPINVLHIITGICGLLAGISSLAASRLYFQIVGILYAIMGTLGFVYEESPVLGIFANNLANTWMHVIAAVSALILGYEGETQE